MIRKPKSVAPSNFVCECACHEDPSVTHPIPCCFACPKCKLRVQAHLYNHHIHTCKRADILKPSTEVKERKPKPPTRKERNLIDIPNLPGPAKTRHRRKK